ncbi:MAG: cache domain-containing protein [Bradymonadaceae bacterium]
MKTSHISILLTVLLVVGVGLSATLLVVGPNRVEQQTVDMYRNQQSLIAEQGAMRISETLRDVQSRLDESVERIERWGPGPNAAGELQQTLYELSHPSDHDLGLALMMVSKSGHVQAVGTGVDDERASTLRNLEFSTPDKELNRPIRLCADCLRHEKSISVVSPLKDGRKLVANIRLDKMLKDVFDRITRGRHAHAALVDGNGDVLFEQRTDEPPTDGDVIAGSANLPHANWRVVVETYRSAIAPEIRATVESVLYACSRSFCWPSGCSAISNTGNKMNASSGRGLWPAPTSWRRSACSARASPTRSATSSRPSR